jgi:hypothetical protein
MSALGQKQTFAVQKGMSALPPEAYIAFSAFSERHVPAKRTSVSPLKCALTLLFLIAQRLKHGGALIGRPERLGRRCELDHLVQLLPCGAGATGR